MAQALAFVTNGNKELYDREWIEIDSLLACDQTKK